MPLHRASENSSPRPHYFHHHAGTWVWRSVSLSRFFGPIFAIFEVGGGERGLLCCSISVVWIFRGAFRFPFFPFFYPLRKSCLFTSPLPPLRDALATLMRLIRSIGGPLRSSKSTVFFHLFPSPMSPWTCWQLALCLISKHPLHHRTFPGIGDGGRLRHSLRQPCGLARNQRMDAEEWESGHSLGLVWI